MTTEVGELSAPEIRARIGHPTIDGDGHLVEVREALVRFVHEHGEERLFDDPSARGLLVPGQEHLRFPSLEERRRLYTHKANRWFTPARTRDYAAVTMPGLMYERLDETGFDFAVVYPTYGIHIAHIAGEAARRGLSRSYNEMVAEDYAPYSDRLTPVAVLPLSTPEEGIEELEHAVSLGLKAFLIPSYVWRTIPAFDDAPPEYRSRLRRMDTFGIDSEYDYDPFWKRSVELNAPISAHMSGAGLMDHVSPSNSLSRPDNSEQQLRHWPSRCSWAACCIVSQPCGWVCWKEESRSVCACTEISCRVMSSGGRMASTASIRAVSTPASWPSWRLDTAPDWPRLSEEWLPPPLAAEEGGGNDFELSGVTGSADIRDQVCRSLYWGCEGDDPLVGVAFDQRANPFGAVLPAFVGSDIGHWDVPSFDYPLREAYQQVEQGRLTAEQFRDLTLTNAVRFYAGDRVDFFDGTTLEAVARAALSEPASSPPTRSSPT